MTPCQVVLIDDCEGVDCNRSCPSQLLVPGSRSDDNSLAVLVVVTTTLACSAVVLVGGAINAFYGIIFVLNRRTQQYVDFVLIKEVRQLSQ